MISTQANSLLALQNLISNQNATIANLQTAVGGQNTTLAALSAKTAPLSLSGTDLTFTGVNVHIVNGMGGTETQNGLGNLIIGYDESRAGSPYGNDVRTGSHNLVTGVLNNYASSGGIIGGYGNALNGVEEFAAGALNSVSGNQSSITGGLSNTTSGSYASVLGGYSNTAAGDNSVVVSGFSNTANGHASAVVAGKSNTAQGERDVVVGGYGNTSDGTDSAIVGGYQNYTYNNYNVVSGGSSNSVTSSFAGAVSGGYSITIVADGQWAAGNGQASADSSSHAGVFIAN